MGGILMYAKINIPNKNTLNVLKSKIMIEPLIEIIDKIEEKIGEETLFIPLDVYKEHLSKYLGQVNSEHLYTMLIDPNCIEKEVIKFELYTLLILISKGSFEAKVNTLFNLYCINDDNTLFGQDLILLIKSAISSIFRVCSVTPPNDDEIKKLLNKHFPLVLTDEFFEITYDEFNEWVSKDDEVHSFLMEFFDMQTRYNAMKAYIKYLSEFELIFDKNKQDDYINKNKIPTRRTNILMKASHVLFSRDDICEPDMNCFCKVDTIFEEIGTLLTKIDPKVEAIFRELIDPDNTGYSRKDRYMKAIKAVCLFMAVDKDMSHSLSQSELGTLLWLLSGEEPNDPNLNATIEKLDANGDSAIELGEWLDFLATRDNKERRVLNYTLKQKFDLYDEDGNGTISIDELQKMIIDSFHDIISKTDEVNKKMAESVIMDLAKILMNKMDINSSNNLDWTEFKHYLKVASEDEEKIAEYIEKYVIN